jgi:hypothetical protein
MRTAWLLKETAFKKANEDPPISFMRPGPEDIVPAHHTHTPRILCKPDQVIDARPSRCNDREGKYSLTLRPQHINSCSTPLQLNVVNALILRQPVSSWWRLASGAGKTSH